MMLVRDTGIDSGLDIFARTMPRNYLAEPLAHEQPAPMLQDS
jgi:hypothetical protein